MGNPTTRAILRSLSGIDLQGTCKKDQGRANNSNRQGTRKLLLFASKELYRDHTMHIFNILCECHICLWVKCNQHNGRDVSRKLEMQFSSSLTLKCYMNKRQMFLSYDVASGSSITPCNKIDKPLLGKRDDVHNNIAYIMAKLYFYARNEISK